MVHFTSFIWGFWIIVFAFFFVAMLLFCLPGTQQYPLALFKAHRCHYLAEGILARLKRVHLVDGGRLVLASTTS